MVFISMNFHGNWQITLAMAIGRAGYARCTVSTVVSFAVIAALAALSSSPSLCKVITTLLLYVGSFFVSLFLMLSYFIYLFIYIF